MEAGNGCITDCPAPANDRDPAARDAALTDKARQLEAAFLAEMLGHAGLDADPTASFGGGAGEEQFASFLRQEQARLMVDRGGSVWPNRCSAPWEGGRVQCLILPE